MKSKILIFTAIFTIGLISAPNVGIAKSPNALQQCVAQVNESFRDSVENKKVAVQEQIKSAKTERKRAMVEANQIYKKVTAISKKDKEVRLKAKSDHRSVVEFENDSYNQLLQKSKAEFSQFMVESKEIHKQALKSCGMLAG